MTAVSAAARHAGGTRWRAWRRSGWTVIAWLLLAATVAWYASLIEGFGNFEIASRLSTGLPLAFLALAQGVVVLSGGVDLGVGAMMVLTNCVAARFMEGRPAAVVLLLAASIIVGAAALDGLVGWVIGKSRVPDIVVTLATSFIFSGLALWVLASPGGGTEGWFQFLFTGSEVGVGSTWWPSLVVLAVATVVVWLFLRRTRTGLSIYAVGSSRDAAFLSGVDVRRTKIYAYAIGGALAACAGLATTAITDNGEPRAAIGSNATLNSVAAVVLGGIALTGGVGSIVGVIAAGYVLASIVPQILQALRIDPNNAEVIKGVLIVLVMAIGGLLALRRRRAAA